MDIAAGSNSQNNLLQNLNDALEVIKDNVATGSISSDAQKQLQSLTRIPEEFVESKAQNCILGILYQDSLSKRYDEVEESHKETFRWIFEECSTDLAVDNTLLDVQRTFIKWLCDGSEFFHILGKLGSGKSTLMKFLFESSKTNLYLKKWATSRYHVGL